MVQLYAHLAPEHLAEHAENISTFGREEDGIRTISGIHREENKKAVTN